MTDVKPILRVAVLAQAANLAARNAKLITKKKKSSKDFLDAGIDTIIGTSFIKAESDLIDNL